MNTASSSENGRARPAIKNLLIASVIGVVGLVLAWLLLTGKPKPQPRDSAPPLRPVVAVLSAEPTAISLPVKSQGTVEALRSISLVAQVGGKVAAVADNFSDGAFFRQGDPLVRIETDDYEFAIARAESQVAAAEQRLAEERGRNRQAKREWRDLGMAEANALFLREPQMKAAQAALNAAQADLAAAKLALERTVVRAPFDGRVASKHVDVGQYVTPAAPVADVYATDRFEVRLPLNATQVEKLTANKRNPSALAPFELDHPVTLESALGSEIARWQGRIRRFEATVDRQSRVVTAIAEITPHDGTDVAGSLLMPGMFVQAEIPTPVIEGITQLPATALRSDNSVLIVDGEGYLQRRVVTVERRSDVWCWVSGLAAGERVVQVQTGVLVAGMAVDVAGDDAAGAN